MSQKFKPPDAFQLIRTNWGHSKVVLKDFGTGGGTLRESYHKAYKTRPQVQTASFLDLPYKVLGLRTWEGGGGTLRGGPEVTGRRR